MVDMKATPTPTPAPSTESTSSTPSAESTAPTPSPAPEPSKTIPFPAAERPPGRPSLLTPELTAEICAAIRIDGMSDTGAGDLAGVSRASISRWKQDDEDFQISLRQA